MDTALEIPDFAADLPELGRTPMPEGNAAPLAADPDPRCLSRVERRRLIELQHEADAAQAIGKLPQPGEVLHIRMDGNFDGWDIIPALVKLLAPAKIENLYLASLSFNRRVADRLLAALDAGDIGRVTFLCSLMFKGKERSTCEYLQGELARRGSLLAYARNHCKLILAGASDGRRIVCEGSQNLRTCRCYEQLTLADDAVLYEWHRQYIERITKGQ